MRVVSIGGDDPYNGWVWITGYVLDVRGMAKAKRELYVMKSGLRSAPASVVVGKPGRQKRVSSRAPA